MGLVSWYEKQADGLLAELWGDDGGFEPSQMRIEAGALPGSYVGIYRHEHSTFRCELGPNELARYGDERGWIEETLCGRLRVQIAKALRANSLAGLPVEPVPWHEQLMEAVQAADLAFDEAPSSTPTLQPNQKDEPPPARYELAAGSITTAPAPHKVP